METSTLAAGPGRARRGRDLLLVAVFTIALHAPFLTQPVQGDEVTYLDIARHALRQPLTPLNFQYVFQGRRVDASGHPHPPLNGYLLALAWTLRGHFSVLFFHAFYLLFALGAAVAGYALAARFTPQPLWGALLLAASPIVQVNANTLASPESPALAFLLAGAAAFFWRRFGIAAVALTMAGMTELQALALPPILLLEYVFKRERPPRAAWLALAAPFLGLAAWEALQWGLTHRFPGAVLLGYAQSGSFSGLGLKAASAMALLGHLGVLVTPSPFARRRLWTLAPGLLAAQGMQTATSESTWTVMGGFTWDRTFHGMYATPVTVAGIVFGQLAWVAVRLTIVAGAFFLVMMAFGFVASPLGVLGIGASVLTGLAFAAPITAFAAGRKNDTAFSVIFRFFITPLFLFSGTFFPIEQLPVVIQPIAWLTPTWHGVQLARGLSLGTIDPLGAVIHLAVLGAYIAAGMVWALFAFRRALSK